MFKSMIGISAFLMVLCNSGCASGGSGDGQKWPVVGPKPYVYTCPDEERCFLDGRNYFPYYPSRTIYYPRGNEEPG